MSARRQIERALHRAQVRDRKRTPKMRVTGKSVLGLSRLLDRRK